MRMATNCFPATIELEASTYSFPPLFIERRIKSRVTVQGGLASFSSLEGFDSAEGDTVLRNLSGSGCQLDSEQNLPEDQPYQLIVFVPLYSSPILIRKVVTQWAKGHVHGIKFLDLDEPASKLKLQKAIHCGPVSSWVLNSIRFSKWSPL